MPTRFAYSKPRDLDVLQDQIIAAGLVPNLVAGVAGDANGIVVGFAQEQIAGPVDAVVAAHDLAAVTAAKQAAASAATTLRTAVLTTAQTAVGVRYDLLAAAQVRALVAILLWQQGALTGAGAVRPLAEWVRDSGGKVSPASK